MKTLDTFKAELLADLQPVWPMTPSRLSSRPPGNWWLPVPGPA
jgi:hypothetical protein